MKKLTIYSDGSHSIGTGSITIAPPNVTVAEVIDMTEFNEREVKEIEKGNLIAVEKRAAKIDKIK